MLYLPLELIIQILLRLPVKSLICFKSVCKSWFTLISDSNFANSHFQFSESTQTTRSRILSLSSTIPPRIQSIDFEALGNNHAASLSLNISHWRYDFTLEIKGSCRGFLFLCDTSKLYLWNPSTGFHKQVCLSYSLRYLYGFGYDQSRDDYVVVSMCSDINVAYGISHLEFFSLRDNRWKETEFTHFPYQSSLGRDNGGTILNEAIHWLACRLDLLVNVIVAFDLTERKLLEMRPPTEIDIIPMRCGLWVFGEFLSLWAMRVGTVEIWVMKEYQEHSSWTKNIVLPIDTLPSKYFRPIYSTKNDDVIGSTDGGSGLVKYNNKGQLLEYRSYYHNLLGSQVAMYTESLLSLPSDYEQV